MKINLPKIGGTIVIMAALTFSGCAGELPNSKYVLQKSLLDGAVVITIKDEKTIAKQVNLGYSDFVFYQDVITGTYYYYKVKDRMAYDPRTHYKGTLVLVDKIEAEPLSPYLTPEEIAKGGDLTPEDVGNIVKRLN